MKLHEISVKRPVAVTMVVLIFVVIGLYSMSMLPLEMMPEMDLSMALVYTQYGTVGSAEVENMVTKTIEGAVSSVSGVKTLTSQSSEGTSLVMAEFSSGTDMDKAVSDMESNIDMIKSVLPDEAGDPMVLKLDTSMMPVAMMSVSYEGYDLIQTKKYVEDNVKNKLEAVDGIASVTLTGAQDRIIEVTVDPEKLFGYNMTLSDVVNGISAQNINMPAGTTEGMNKKLSARAIGKFKKVEDVSVVPLITSQGQVVYLKDVASVKDTYSDASSIARLNGENSISLSIASESDANTVDVVNEIYKVLDGLKESNPKFSYNMTMEQGTYIEDSIRSVAENAITGGILAVLVLLLFLGSIRTSLVIGISMPVSIVTTFIGMYFSGMSLNVVSLGGLALGVGMLVDNAVVVLENIFRRRQACGDDAKTGAIRGAGEVIGAVVASVLTTCIVYVPLLFIDNMMAIMFKQFAFAIIFSQIASLLVTFLLIPMFTSKLETVGKKDKYLLFILNPFEKLLNKFFALYEKTLGWVLSHRKRFIAAVLALFVVSLGVLSTLGMTLMENADEGIISVSIELPQGSKLEDTDKLCMQLENIIKDNENVKTVFSSVGSGGQTAMLGGTASNTATITVTLSDDRKQSTDDVIQTLREQCADVTGATIQMSSSNTGMSLSADEIQYQFSGSNDSTLEDYVNKAEEVLASVDGVSETSTSISETKSEVRIKLDSAKAAMYGMNTATAANLIKGALDGTKASSFSDNGSEYDIKVVYPKNYISNYNDLKTVQLKSLTGQWITLSDIADVTVEQGQSSLMRIDQKRVYTLTGKLYGTDMQTVSTKFKEALAKIDTPDGVTEEAGGTYEVMMDAMKSLLLAILLGILLMYMVMAAQFESLRQPFIILFTLPLAMIGVVLSLVIAGSPLSVISCIGILMLIGIVVNNAIVLIDFVNTAREENPEENRTEILVTAGLTRIRPILMTSLTSILGFLPMAFATSNGDAMMKPLAVVLVGGLTVGTFLTLLVIPAVYSIMDDGKIKREKKKQKRLAKKHATV